MPRHTVRLDPGFADAADALAEALLREGNTAYDAFDAEAAEMLYREALPHHPNLVPALGNLGNALAMQNRVDESLASYARALEPDPDDADIGFSYGLALLRKGDFAAGWPRHEARLRVKSLQSNYDRRHDLPRWRPGMDLTGRHVLLMAEQGFGDIVQYARSATLADRQADEDRRMAGGARGRSGVAARQTAGTCNMKHRHLAHRKLIAAAIEDILTRSRMPDWLALIATIHADPYGEIAEKTAALCEDPLYGAPVFRRVLAGARRARP